MDQPNKPIKRSKELVPLSKEHHEGLLFGWKIRQGLANGTEKATISQFIQWFWEADLQDHFRKEEQVLAPHLPQDNEWVKQMFSEHEEIEALIHVNAMIPDEDIMSQLADSITNHIRFEERVLFPYAEEVIPANEMEEIFRRLIQTKKQSNWKEEFWVKKKD